MAASRHTHNFCKCSHASVGLAQARPDEVMEGGSQRPLHLRG